MAYSGANTFASVSGELPNRGPAIQSLLNSDVLEKLPSFEKFCARVDVDLEGSDLPIPSTEQLFRVLYKENVGLRTIFEGFRNAKLLKEDGDKIISFYTGILQLGNDQQNKSSESNGDGKSFMKTGLAMLGVSALTGVGAFVAAPMVAAAAGLSTAGFSAGSIGALVMSTVGRTAAAGSVAAILQLATSVGLPVGATTFGLSTGAGASIGLASACTTFGIGNLMCQIRDKINRIGGPKPRGLSDYCRKLYAQNLLTPWEQMKILSLEKIGKSGAALLILANAIFERDIGIKTLLRGTSIEYVDEVITNVFNTILEEADAKSSLESTFHFSDQSVLAGDVKQRGKLCVIATIAGIWSTIFTSLVLSVFEVESNEIEGCVGMGYLFVSSIGNSLAKKIPK